jgi:hypothetical protein
MLAAWAIFPAILLAVCLGNGLLAGEFGVEAEVPRTGRYEIWLGGSIRPLATLFVDERPVAAVRQQLNTAGHYLDFGSVGLTRGAHTFAVTMGGPRPAPRQRRIGRSARAARHRAGRGRPTPDDRADLGSARAVRSGVGLDRGAARLIGLSPIALQPAQQLRHAAAKVRHGRGQLGGRDLDRGAHRKGGALGAAFQAPL